MQKPDYLSAVMVTTAILILILTIVDICLYLSLPEPRGFIYFDTEGICLNDHDGIYWSGAVACIGPAGYGRGPAG